jgi:alpha-beta hydrolase superfamily lysophospholipase
MILVPTAKPPADGRKIVAWAHPTLGMGDACAPSRSADTLLDMGFAQEMINNGWVITATDYAGVGTQGTGRYLVGQDEANDVAFSVAMAHNFPAADTSKTWAVYGHSQGGHSALWTGELGESILPDFKLVGTAAVAPAAELETLIAQQWDKPAQWSIGPDFIVGWSSKYPNLPLNGILTDQGSANYQSLSQDCIVEAALEGHTRAEFGQSLFTKNPLDDPAWSKIAQEQTPPPMRPAMPTFIVQGTGDTLVLPNTQAELSDRWCRAGSDLSMLWLDGASHLSAQSLSGTAVSQWIQARFDGRPASSTCGLNLPVKPYGSNR